MLFFQRDTVEVARDLLGKTLVRRKNGVTYAGRIVETEAYLGLEDPACHSFHGKKTPRTETFYMEGGHVYVYLIYGMYYCLNFITGCKKTPEAVLIRALEPLQGIEHMMRNRHTDRVVSLCNGPGKLCEAISVTKEDNGLSVELTGLQVLDGPLVSDEDIVSCNRIGLNQIHDSCYWPLRFYLKNNPYVSRP